MKFKHFQSIWVAFACIAMLSLQANNAHAKNSFNPDKITQVVNIYEAVVQHPVPSWITSNDFVNQVEVFREQKGTTFVLEFIPKGEKFESWSKMLAVQGDYLPRKDKISLKRFALSSLLPLMQACGNGNFDIAPVTEAAEVATYLMVCASTPNGPKQLGYGPETGEIMLKTIRRFNDTYISVRHEWRGTNFNLQDVSGWPVSEAVLSETARRFTKIKLTKSMVPFK